MKYFKARHPYENKVVAYSYIGSMSDGRDKVHLFNSEDGYTVSLETILKPKKPKTGVENRTF